MPRIPYPDLDALPEVMRKMLAGTPLNVVRMGAHAAQPLFEAQGQLGWAIARPDVLDPKLRETVILRVAYLSNSAYELHQHIGLARAAGLSEAELAALKDADYAKLEPKLAAAAAFTDAVVTDLSPSDAVLYELRDLVGDKILVNIVLTIGCYMSIARLIAVTGIEIDANTLDHLPSSLEDSVG
jgi:alkylhydroperoxidase family enzyme